MRLKASRTFAHRSGPRMAARTLASAILVSRQRDGLATGFARSRGGRVRDLPGAAFCNQEGNQPCVNPGPRQLWFLGGQFVEAGEALHPLKGEFELPPKAVEREHIGGREGGGRQRGQQQDILRGLQAARIGGLAAFLGIFQQALPLRLGLFRALE